MPAPVLVLEGVESFETDETAARILDAVLACWARFGVAKSTLDDIAREAGCSRATVYRGFANRTLLVTAAVGREIDRLTAEVVRAGEGAEDLEDAVVAMMTTAARVVDGHEVFQRTLELEPEVVLPALSFEGGSLVLAEAARRFAPVFARFVPPDRAARAAEWCTRVLLAYLHPDRGAIAMTDERSVRALVRAHVIPAIAPRPIVTTR
jgi:AcrR family transcriptional regulator